MLLVKENLEASIKAEARVFKMKEQVFVYNSGTLIEKRNFEINFLEIDHLKPSRPCRGNILISQLKKLFIL